MSSISPSNASKSCIQNYAEKVSAQFSLNRNWDILKGDEDPLILFVQELGGKVIYAKDYEWAKREDSALLIRGQNDFEILTNPWTGPLRDRFTVAHELGHYFVHSRQGQHVFAAPRRGGAGLEEWEANWFALGLLMPKEEVLKKWKNDVLLLAGQFRLPWPVAKKRVEELGLIQ